MKTMLFVALLAAGSAHAADAKIETDAFDGATRVWVDPHGLDCGAQMVCPLLGARWTSGRKDEAVLQVEVVNVYAGIRGAALNVGGEIIELVPLDEGAATRFTSNVQTAAGAPVSRRSSRDYLVPLALVRKIADAPSVKVRVYTAEGTVDGTLAGGKKPAKAYGALQRFVAKVATTGA